MLKSWLGALTFELGSIVILGAVITGIVGDQMSPRAAKRAAAKK